MSAAPFTSPRFADAKVSAITPSSWMRSNASSRPRVQIKRQAVTGVGDEGAFAVLILEDADLRHRDAVLDAESFDDVEQSRFLSDRVLTATERREQVLRASGPEVGGHEEHAEQCHDPPRRGEGTIASTMPATTSNHGRASSASSPKAGLGAPGSGSGGAGRLAGRTGALLRAALREREEERVGVAIARSLGGVGGALPRFGDLVPARCVQDALGDLLVDLLVGAGEHR